MAAEAAAAAAVVEAQTNRKKVPPPPPLIVQPMLQRSTSYEEVLNVRLVVSLFLSPFPFLFLSLFYLHYRSKDASPTVSFADIVNDQLREMNQLSRQ